MPPLREKKSQKLKNKITPSKEKNADLNHSLTVTLLNLSLSFLLVKERKIIQ